MVIIDFCTVQFDHLQCDHDVKLLGQISLLPLWYNFCTTRVCFHNGSVLGDVLMSGRINHILQKKKLTFPSTAKLSLGLITHILVEMHSGQGLTLYNVCMPAFSQKNVGH